MSTKQEHITSRRRNSLGEATRQCETQSARLQCLPRLALPTSLATSFGLASLAVIRISEARKVCQHM
eukprot:1991640-Amphidinium_carterae.1